MSPANDQPQALAAFGPRTWADPGAVGLTLPVEAQPDLSQLRVRVESRIHEVPGAVVGIALRDLGSGAHLDLNADSVFHAASTMKVPVMIEYFRAVDAGRITPDQGILLVNQFVRRFNRRFRRDAQSTRR